MRRAAKVDRNQAEIVKALRKAGCSQCGKSFLISDKRKRFCSQQCGGRYVGINFAKTRNRGLIRHYECETCGIGFSRYYNNMKYCSRTCMGIAKRGRPMRGRTGGRKDKNQKGIEEGLKDLGYATLDLSRLGRGAPDLLVATDKGVFLFEIKNPENSYGRKGLNKNQEEWHKNWRGQVSVVRTFEECLTIIQASGRR